MKKTTRRAVIASIACTPIAPAELASASSIGNQPSTVLGLVNAHRRAYANYMAAIEANDETAIAETAIEETAAASALSTGFREHCGVRHPEFGSFARHGRLEGIAAMLRYEREARESGGRSPFACEMDDLMASFLFSLEVATSRLAGLPVPNQPALNTGA
jgi:hypothetical protein